MNLKIKLLLFVFCVCIQTFRATQKVSLDLSGQAVLWSVAQFEDPFVLQSGGRFVPALKGNYELRSRSFLDIEASLNINGNTTIEHREVVGSSASIKPYRLWTRYVNESFELRVGLQQINFGSAKMFRPLMWFDGMDVRDPLQLTDGVYAVLGRYYFKNNANVWMWGLLGNDSPKGYELFGSSLWKPEFGGRLEQPAGPGEFGLSYHHRRVNPARNLMDMPLPSTGLTENRIGLNGKWDVIAGVWFESSLSFLQKNTLSIPTKTDMLNVGFDYTFPLGNGLGVTLEYFRYHTGDLLFKGGTSAQLLGTMVSYPVSLMDNLSGMLFFIPDADMWLNYLSWSRMYDNLSLYIIAFWNPVHYDFSFMQQPQGRNMFAGKGAQVMLSYYF